MQENALLSQNDLSTVIACYESKRRSDESYQSENDLEISLINDLTNQGYEYAKHIKDYASLKQNLKEKLENLNNIQFSQSEWERFYKNVLKQKTLVQKTQMIQEDLHTEILERDNGETKNIKLLDTRDINKNHLQVINQFENNNGKYKNRYDVTLLVNGLPFVHIELKRRGVDLKEAFNQINRYSRNSFSAGDGLFEYIQIFVISNGTKTKYYSNSTRYGSKSQNCDFSFSMYWSDARNRIILDLEDFTKTFFAKHTILSILTKFCVFDTNETLLVMRPYQIAASERILEKITMAHNHKLYGSIDSGGYIWHTTGSGKTLTSFKTAQLACRLEFIKKVLFVVDRKDLDYQTMKEYDRFQKGAANSTKNTKELESALKNPESKIIITTIQKLSIFVKKNKGHSVFNDEIVIIFDECHRSQFGDMHKLITKEFKKYYLFGFSGTPIMEENAPSGKYTTIKEKDIFGNEVKKAALQTTDTTFGKCLHTYTIVNAIRDDNVLPFMVKYISTMKEKNILAQEAQEEVSGINKDSALKNPKRLHNIVKYILEHFDEQTKRREDYTLEGKKAFGFNAIFATQDVEAAKLYYKEFQTQLESMPEMKRLKVGIIYSYGANENDDEIDEGADNKDSREFLDSAINDYNAMFGTNFSTQNFDNYYKDVAKKLKDKELDLLIVVNMFLTGFDAKTLNTLLVDKNLKYHSLIQSFSRTNRILNKVKTFGNIVCFRNLEKATNESLKLYSDEEQIQSIVLLRGFEDYLEGYIDANGEKHRGYKEAVEILKQQFPIDKLSMLVKKDDKKNFIELFNEILKLENILNAFDEFSKLDTLYERDKQDYQSYYIDLYQELRPKNTDNVPIDDDIVFEMDIIKQVEVSVEYIMLLLEQYHKEENKGKEHKLRILKIIESSPSLRNKRELLREFLEILDGNKGEDFDTQFREFIKAKYEKNLQDLIKNENLEPQKTLDFMRHSLKIKEFQESGTDINEILPRFSIFASGKEGERLNLEHKEKKYKIRELFEIFKEFSAYLV